MVVKMNRDKERDRQIIKNLKAQINQLPTKNIKGKEPKQQKERRQILETPSKYVVTKRSSGKINSSDKLTDGVSPKAKFWLISIVNKLTVNNDHYATKSTKIAFIWGRTDRLA